jgi:copper transport protein
VGTVDELTTTSYGRALLVKTALLAGLLAVGAVSARRVHAAGRPLTIRLLTLEAGVGVALLVAVALLAETPPPRDQAGAPVVEAVSRSGQVDDLVVSVSVSPNLPGPNGFAAVVASSRRPAPAAVDSVTLLVGSAGPAAATVQLRPTGADRWFGTTDLDVAGPAQVEVVVVRAGHRLTVPLAWDVDATTPAAAPAPTGRELAPIADAIAVALVVAIVVGVVVARRRRSRVPSAPADDEVLVGS